MAHKCRYRSPRQIRHYARMSDVISRAIVVWSGWGSFSSPRQDEQLVVDAFGADEALDLIPEVRRLADDFYKSDARHRAKDLVEMGELASTAFRVRHPEVSGEAVGALAWCYTFDYK
jgi:hypothetical protein